jgi:O-antigen/teichoic acid export membrane protein
LINYLARIDISAILFVGVNFLSSVSALATAYLFVIIFEPDSRGVIVMISMIGSIASSLLDFGTGITASRLYKIVEDRNAILACLDVISSAKVFLILIIMFIAYKLDIHQFISLNQLDMLMGLFGAIPIIIISSHMPILVHTLELKKYLSLLALQAVMPLLAPSLLYFVFDCSDLIVHFIGIIFLNIALALLTYILLPRNLASYAKINQDRIKSLFSGLSIGYASLFNLIVSRGWYFWISGNMGMHYVGIISLTQSIAERLSMIGDAFGQAGFRRTLINTSLNNVWSGTFKKLFIQSTLISVIIAGLIFGFTDVLFNYLPDNYREGSLFLRGFLISYLFHSMYRVIHHMLLSAGYSGVSFKNYLISGLVLFVALFVGEGVPFFSDPLISFMLSSIALLLLAFTSIKLCKYKDSNYSR